MNGRDDHGPDMKKSRTLSELEQFDEVFPEILDKIMNLGQGAEVADAYSWFKEVLQYNVPYGKKNRGMFVVLSYKLLKPDAEEEDIHLARVLGWCIEILQAFFLVADDIMDNSLTRRGQTCWYKKEGVGMEAINDAFFLESCLYQLIRAYCRHKPYYIDIVDLFREITHCTVIGQCLDMTVAPPEGTVNFTRYTSEKYDAIVKWKTAFYSFYLPVAIAVYMVGIDDDEAHASAKSILLKMGHFFQIQDDYLDCFGDPAVIGKIGTDIEDNKCSWLVVNALGQATEPQRQVLQENYGSKDPEKVARIKELYRELDLPGIYSKYEEDSYQDILKQIDTHHGEIPKELFLTLVNKIYKRSK